MRSLTCCSSQRAGAGAPKESNKLLAIGRLAESRKGQEGEGPREGEGEKIKHQFGALSACHTSLTECTSAAPWSAYAVCVVDARFDNKRASPRLLCRAFFFYSFALSAFSSFPSTRTRNWQSSIAFVYRPTVRASDRVYYRLDLQRGHRVDLWLWWCAFDSVEYASPCYQCAVITRDKSGRGRTACGLTRLFLFIRLLLLHHCRSVSICVLPLFFDELHGDRRVSPPSSTFFVCPIFAS